MVSVYVGFEASKPDLRRINPDSQLWADKDGTHIHTSRGILQRQYRRWVGDAFMETIKALCNAYQRLGLRFDSSVGQRCLVAQTMNGAHKLTSEGGGSSSGGNGAAAQSKAGASSGNDRGRSTTDRLLRQKFFDLLVQVDTRCCLPC